MSTTPVQHLILISGPPGVGKSTLARPLAQKIGAVLLDKDCIDEPFSPNDRGKRYTQEIEPKVLQGLLNLAELNLTNSLSVILDVPWTHIMHNSPEWVGRITALAEKTQSHLVVLECVIESEKLRHRIQNRDLARDHVKLTDEGWALFTRTDRIGDRNPLPHATIDMSQSLDVCLTQAYGVLRQLA